MNPSTPNAMAPRDSLVGHIPQRLPAESPLLATAPRTYISSLLANRYSDGLLGDLVEKGRSVRRRWIRDSRVCRGVCGQPILRHDGDGGAGFGFFVGVAFGDGHTL